MVRLSDLHQAEADHKLHATEGMHAQNPATWIKPKPLAESTIALISTAGLHRRSDPPFKAGAIDYRILPGDVDFADVIASHISSNFDRSGFQRDPNIWLPLDRLREMAANGEIGGISKWHYTFMGGQNNHEALADAGEEVGRLLAADEVDVALMIPV